jgi:hypothetical protein
MPGPGQERLHPRGQDPAAAARPAPAVIGYLREQQITLTYDAECPPAEECCTGGTLTASFARPQGGGHAGSGSPRREPA